MKDFYIRTKTHWVKVSRNRDRKFTFAIGFKNNAFAYRVHAITAEFMPTIKDAREHARYLAVNP